MIAKWLALRPKILIMDEPTRGIDIGAKAEVHGLMHGGVYVSCLSRYVSGTIHPGNPVWVWPGGRTSKVKRIVTYDGDLDVAIAPMSVTLVLENELDISRGDLLASGLVDVGNCLSAQLVWMDERPLDPGRTYLLKHATCTVTAQVDTALELNQIGRSGSPRHDRLRLTPTRETAPPAASS